MALTNLGVYFLYFFYTNYYANDLCPLSTDFTCGNNPVCTIYKGDTCDNGLGFCQREDDNDCAACEANDTVSYYPGPCAEAPIHICDASERNPDVCHALYAPVCGLSYVKKNRSVKEANFSNGCNACADPSIAFYVDGPCHLDYETTHTTDANGKPVIVKTLSDESGTGGSYPDEQNDENGATITSEYSDLREVATNLTVSIPMSGRWEAVLSRNDDKTTHQSTRTVIPAAPGVEDIPDNDN